MKSMTCWLVATEQLPDTMACSPCAAGRRQPRCWGHAKVARQANGHARACGDQRHALEGRAQAQQVGVGHRIDHGHAHALGLQLVDARADGGLALCDHAVVDQAHAAGCLRLQHAHQVGVGHGRERVVLHAALVQQHIAHKQVALEHGALVVGEGGRGDGEVGAQGLHQRIGHGADVAFGRAVKRGAVFEVDLLGALRLQPLQRGQRLGNGFVLGMVRDLSATTMASASVSNGAVGTPMACTTRMPARTRLLARSVAPVKSSAMQPSRARARVMPFSLASGRVMPGRS